MNHSLFCRQTKNLQKLIERELALGTAGSASSWHSIYKDSAWIFIGGLNYELNEGDIITVFSQYGEIVNVNLVRDKVTGKSKGFAFVCYEDQRSTVLAVDNLNAITLVGRIIRVDHVESYKVPKMDEEMDEDVKKLIEEGCAPVPVAMGGKGVQIKREVKQEDEKKRERKRDDKDRDTSRHSHSSKDRHYKEDTSESKREHRRRERSRSRSRDDRRRSDGDSSHHHRHHNESKYSRSRRSVSRERSHHSRDTHRGHRHKDTR